MTVLLSILIHGLLRYNTLHLLFISQWPSTKSSLSVIIRIWYFRGGSASYLWVFLTLDLFDISLCWGLSLNDTSPLFPNKGLFFTIKIRRSEFNPVTNMIMINKDSLRNLSFLTMPEPGLLSSSSTVRSRMIIILLYFSSTRDHHCSRLFLVCRKRIFSRYFINKNKVT